MTKRPATEIRDSKSLFNQQKYKEVPKVPRRIPSRYREYFELLEKLGLEQLDVYRHKDHDTLRLRTTEGKILLIELPGFREDLDLKKLEELLTKHTTLQP